MTPDTWHPFGTFDAPPPSSVPPRWRQDVSDLFDLWGGVRSRNSTLSTYYNMRNRTRDLGVSIPPQLVGTNAVVGWASKAVKVMSVRSRFDGYVSGGSTIAELDALVRSNRLRTKYSLAVEGALTHGVSFVTAMPGGAGQPAAVVRVFSANQAACLWDKDAERIACGVTLADVDREGRASRYVCHFADAVLTLARGGSGWSCSIEPHGLGRPMMEPMVYDADADRPLGRSRITPEVMGIIDKAMRDVLRMEVGAEFFTAPQRYILGADESLFAPLEEPRAEPNGEMDEDETVGAMPHRQLDRADALRYYIGAYLAITRGPNGEAPQVGQFPAADADNFVRVFESDAQRFSGATNVPLGQLGVLSNTYTSSDALGAANDPLILEVERMNDRNKETMEEVARMMACVSRGVPMDRLPVEYAEVQAYLPDPSMPTLAARADAWTKLGAIDPGLVGTRVWYEGLGMPQATIDRIMAARRERSAIEALNAIADGMATEDA